MTQEEFDQLVADRNESIVDLIVNLLVNSSTFETPPANELIVDYPHDSNGTDDIPPQRKRRGEFRSRVAH